MILTFDIGNTNITFGGFEEEKLVFVANISTDIVKTSDEYLEENIPHIEMQKSL